MHKTSDQRERSVHPNILSDAAPFDDATTHDLRTLMALAAALRHLALDSAPREATLYLTTAVTLHWRAARLAGLHPHEPDPDDPPGQTVPRQRVDIHI